MLDWNKLTREHVLKALSAYDNNPQNASSKTTFLVHEGRDYPAKYIRGKAYEIAFNYMPASVEYSGGKETERFFKRLGFEIELRNIIKASSTIHKLWKTPNRKLGVKEQKNALQKLLQKRLD